MYYKDRERLLISILLAIAFHVVLALAISRMNISSDFYPEYSGPIYVEIEEIFETIDLETAITEDNSEVEQIVEEQIKPEIDRIEIPVEEGFQNNELSETDSAPIETREIFETLDQPIQEFEDFTDSQGEVVTTETPVIDQIDSEPSEAIDNTVEPADSVPEEDPFLTDKSSELETPRESVWQQEPAEGLVQNDPESNYQQSEEEKFDQWSKTAALADSRQPENDSSFSNTEPENGETGTEESGSNIGSAIEKLDLAREKAQNEGETVDSDSDSDSDSEDNVTTSDTTSDGGNDADIVWDSPGSGRKLIKYERPHILLTDFEIDPVTLDFFVVFQVDERGKIIVRDLKYLPDIVPTGVKFKIRQSMFAWVFDSSPGSDPVSGSVRFFFKVGDYR
jgi:hypothetical protein